MKNIGLRKILATSILSSLGVCAHSASVTFTPMGDLTILTSPASSLHDTRTMAVSNRGEVAAIDASENVIIWTEQETYFLGNHDCDVGSTGEPTNLMHIASNGNQMLWRCKENGAPKLSKRLGDGYSTSWLDVSGQYISGPDLNTHISSKAGNAFSIAPHRASAPNAGQPRVALQVAGTIKYIQQYFDAAELQNGSVMGFSDNGDFAAVRAGSELYIANLNSQSVHLVEGDFRSVFFVSDDGKTVIGSSGGCLYGFCSTTVDKWSLGNGVSTISDSSSGVWSGIQDVSSSGKTAIHYEFSRASDFSISAAAFLWTESNGNQAFEDFILSNSGDLRGWTDLKPIGISQNGLFITGVGTNSEGTEGKGFLVEINPYDQCVATY